MERECDNCKHKMKGIEQYPCVRCKRNAVDMWEQETNADRIKNMGCEELAEFLVNFKNTFGEEYEGEQSCLDWLKKGEADG